MKDNTTSFRTISRLLTTLELTAAHPNGLTLSEFINKLDVPKSSMYYLLQELQKSGYIVYNKRKKNYIAGSNMIRLGAVIIHENTLQPLARPSLEQLSEETGEDVYLGIRANDHLLYIDKVEGKESVRLNVPVGFKRNLYNTSIGKLLLAYFDEDEMKDYLSKHALEKTGKNTITDKSRLVNELKKIRENGFSITNEESMDGIFSMAAPIKNADGKIVAGIGVSVPVIRGVSRTDFLKERVSHASNQISKRLGFNVKFLPE
jgi:IclR family KDG regulon transcriptional repressor